MALKPIEIKSIECRNFHLTSGEEYFFADKNPVGEFLRPAHTS
jgi:hypothetical protein